MKIIFSVLSLFLACNVMADEHAWKGNLDLDLNAQAIGFRELHDGNWLAGISKKAWHLDEIQNGVVKERLHIEFFTAWRAMSGDPAYGLSLGINTGKLGELLESAASIAMPSLYENVKWVSQLSNWVSLDTYVGYRPFHGTDTHDFIYGVGGKVKIPLDLIKGL